jgi:hypothetical protein
MKDAEARVAIRKLRRRVGRLERRVLRLEAGAALRRRRKPRSSKSTMAVLTRLLQQAYFTSPRTLGDIQRKLAAIGHHRIRTSLTNPLHRAAKTGLLQREKVSGEWRYTGSVETR